MYRPKQMLTWNVNIEANNGVASCKHPHKGPNGNGRRWGTFLLASLGKSGRSLSYSDVQGGCISVASQNAELMQTADHQWSNRDIFDRIRPVFVCHWYLWSVFWLSRSVEALVSNSLTLFASNWHTHSNS